MRQRRVFIPVLCFPGRSGQVHVPEETVRATLLVPGEVNTP